MKRLNPIERSQYINKRYKEYLRSSFEFGNKQLQNLFEDQLDKEILFKGPYVNMNYPFERGHNLEYLINNGVVCESFKKIENINLERPLYSHQEESIKLVKNGRSAIITTGTGSGKTESFLYPILNDLLHEVEKGNTDVGIRAIFLYPMNALVNDQIDRIRKILKNCSEITFGFFTGDTPTETNANTREKLGKENGIVITDNELVSRAEIRENPPHLLFTNYSMLEYLLIRPNDYSIFEPDRLKNWKYVVLDEAHTYKGSLGIEISLLLRRLTGLACKKPQFILTSATLGERGKSEADIVKFAKSLTSADFSESDIIFSKRIHLQNRSEYRILSDDYCHIKKALQVNSNIHDIVSKYLKYNSANTRELLYELLSRDKNVHDLSLFLKDGSKEFQTIYKHMHEHVSEEGLIALIDIINLAEKDGVGLFDLKYHSFIRPLSGAYIAYGKEQKLTLTKTSEIDGMKAFEIGNCRYCNSPYIIGKIKTSEENKLDYLFQNKEVDIYENYGDEKSVKIDYFLLENSINEDEVDKEVLEPFEVCAKCGEIHAKDNLNAKKCECGIDYHFTIYKVVGSKNDKDNFIYNNINQCPCCGHRGKSGVVKALNVGKDEGTALVAQMLYEAIDEGDVEPIKSKKISLRPIQNIEKENGTDKVKQFLTFSDSRQQASFAAVFFNSNHVRMLRKRLIWETIKNNNYEEMKVDELTARLEKKIKESDLFPDYSRNGMNAHKNAWAAVLVDLLKVDGAYDGEGLGLYYFDIDLKEILSSISDEEISSVFNGLKITKEKLYTFMQVVLGVFKTTPAIDHVKSTLDPNERKDILEYRRFSNYIALQNPTKSKKQSVEDDVIGGIRSFLPVKDNSNAAVRYTTKVFEVNAEKANEILGIVFGLLVQINELEGYDGFLTKHDKKEAYQINASRFVVKNYKKSKYFRCNKCGRLTPYNVNDKCVQDKCTGTLVEVNPDEVLETNFYRQQYKNKKIESIVIKEHTAQLEKEQAKQYQNDFKNKKINILSCSTTFEMGIDIGDLETVFMRNVPPTPANYVQRAGRAGRRKDSAAYILTYCGTGSHDYTYYSEPEKMISGVINPPYFDVLNKKIIIRHLMATSLGYFFRQYPEYFRNLDAFVINGNGAEKFNEYISLKPKELNEYINKKILPEPIYDKYKNFKWLEEIDGKDEKMSYFVETIREMIEEFTNAKNEAINKQARGDEKASRDVTYYINQINNIKNKSVLDSLSKYCVIPKYGFPVDVVDLQIYDNGVAVNKYDLSRDLRLAISEYAPDSEVIVDGNKYTSKYIGLKKNAEFTKNWFVTCPSCNKINVYLSKNENSECKYCGEAIPLSCDYQYYIEPSNGFKTGQTKESSALKPKRSYAGEVLYLGNGKTDEQRMVFGEALGIETSSDDELLVMNKSGFYMCPVCGYGEIEKRCSCSPIRKKKHKNVKLFECENDELNYLKLGHKFQTDVARFTIPSLGLSEKTSYAQALSFMYAFLEGISIALDIERNDIDGVLETNFESQSFDILLYDNVPGGAGHIKRLLNKESVIKSLQAALEKVSAHCCDENTSCYNCLRNYYNQSYHDKLQRKLAIESIKRLLFEIDGVSEIYQNERWHWKRNTKQNSKMKLSLGPDGRNPGNDPASEIWSELLEDCADENEIEIISKIKDISPNVIANPYYNKTIKIEDTGEEIMADYVWHKEETMLFLNERYDDYQKAKKTGWNVYCTKVGFDINELLNKVGR